MKKTLLLGLIFTFLTSGFQSAFGFSNSEDNRDQNANQDQRSTGEKTDAVDVDSTQIMTQPADSEYEGEVRRIAPAENLNSEKATLEKGEREQPAEDQSKTAVSSFNVFYYLIEKIKFPDLLDESF